MEIPIKQLSKLLSDSQHILVTGPSDPNVDVVSAASAWQLFLISQNKKVDLVLVGENSKLDFLPDKVKIEKSLGHLNKFKIILDTSETKVRQLSYDVNDTELVIDVVPENGQFQSENVSTQRGDYKYDLVIILGAESLDSLGEPFEENRHFFHQVPIVNLDSSVVNENFGQLDIVEPKATSVSEISYQALKKYLNPEIATCLLAGMIASTNSFQSPKVTPETLELASELIIAGADREKIIDSLYRTKDIKTLKNWGRILSRLHKENYIISSYLKHDELEYLPEDFAQMVRELILSSPDSQAAVIFYQKELYQTEAWIYTIKNINALDLSKDFQPSGHKHLAKLEIEKDMDEASQEVLDKISQKLRIINSQ